MPPLGAASASALHALESVPATSELSPPERGRCQIDRVDKDVVPDPGPTTSTPDPEVKSKLAKTSLATDVAEVTDVAEATEATEATEASAIDDVFVELRNRSQLDPRAQHDELFETYLRHRRNSRGAGACATVRH